MEARGREALQQQKDEKQKAEELAAGAPQLNEREEQLLLDEMGNALRLEGATGATVEDGPAADQANGPTVEQANGPAAKDEPAALKVGDYVTISPDHVGSFQLRDFEVHRQCMMAQGPAVIYGFRCGKTEAACMYPDVGSIQP